MRNRLHPEASEDLAVALPPQPAARDRLALVTSLQQTAGNAAVARMLAPSAQVARFKRDTAGAVGGHSADADVLDDPLHAGRKLKVGQQGYVRQALQQVPQRAGKKLQYYAENQLRPVDITFNELDKQAAESREKQEQAERDQGGTPSTVASYQRRIDQWKKSGEVIASQKVRQQQWVQRFNAGVPRANHMLIGLARLDALQTTLGVSDPQKMAESVVYALDQAKPLAERAQRGGAELDVPDANLSVSAAARQLSVSQSKMQTAWLGVQNELTKDHIAAVKEKGTKDRERLEQINKNIAAAKSIGSVIDAGMGVMGKAGPALEGTSSTLSKKQLNDLLEDENPDVRDRSGATSAKESAKAITDAIGLEIPTSAGGLLEFGAKIYYSGELEGIRRRLRLLDIEVEAYTKASGEILLKKTVSEYKDALNQFEEDSKVLQNALRARQLSYMKMGEQMDRAARKDAGMRGDAFGKQERFATLMTLVAAVREVLALADGAQAGFDMHPLQLGMWILALDEEREMFSYTLEEDRAMGRIISQLKDFEKMVDGLREILGPIDAKAGEMMKATSAGAGEAAAY